MRHLRVVLLIVAALYVIVLATGLGVFDTHSGPSSAFAYEYSTTITTTTTTTTSTSSSTSTTTSTSTTRPPACVYTPGYYKNHPSVVASAVADAGGTLRLGNQQLNATQVQAVLNATAGRHPGVTFTSNALLTLAQHVLAAELNIARGAPASASVLNAIAQANAGIQVTISGGTVQIATTLSQNQISTLTNTLDRFNSGRLGADSCRS
jgi:cytoskeletal protein RodZ